MKLKNDDHHSKEDINNLNVKNTSNLNKKKNNSLNSKVFKTKEQLKQSIFEAAFS